MVRDKNDGDKPAKRVIVDLDFMSEFEIVRPTKMIQEIEKRQKTKRDK